jgi:DNA-binding transcriptional MocR family regulator
LLPHANAHGMAFIPGVRSHLDGSGHEYLRMAFTLFSADHLSEAARRLGEAIRTL